MGAGELRLVGGRRGDRRSLFEFHVNPELHALVGCGLGGTSLINANVVEPAEDAVFADPVWPAALRVTAASAPAGSMAAGTAVAG